MYFGHIAFPSPNSSQIPTTSLLTQLHIPSLKNQNQNKRTKNN